MLFSSLDYQLRMALSTTGAIQRRHITNTWAILDELKIYARQAGTLENDFENWRMIRQAEEADQPGLPLTSKPGFDGRATT